MCVWGGGGGWRGGSGDGVMSGRELKARARARVCVCEREGGGVGRRGKAVGACYVSTGAGKGLQV